MYQFDLLWLLVEWGAVKVWWQGFGYKSTMLLWATFLFSKGNQILRAVRCQWSNMKASKTRSNSILSQWLETKLVTCGCQPSITPHWTENYIVSLWLNCLSSWRCQWYIWYVKSILTLFWSTVNFVSLQMAEQKIILVTGGTGLVGKALEEIVATEEKRSDETWIFLSSKDGDLWWDLNSMYLKNYLWNSFKFIWIVFSIFN